MSRLSKKDIAEFELYLRQCTDAQVQGVMDKERKAGRTQYYNLAANEQVRRKLEKE